MESQELKNIGTSVGMINGARLEVIANAVKETRELDGEVWECGAYKGGTAAWIKSFLLDIQQAKILRVFDTFGGMPNYLKGVDSHTEGTFSDTNYEVVRGYFESFSDVFVYKGVMPDTFNELKDRKISVAHIDVDNYDSVKGVLEFVYPRVLSGGVCDC